MRTSLLVTLLIAAAATPLGAAPGKGRSTADAHCSFNAKTLTWTIGNASVERTLQFDRTAGRLTTVDVSAPGCANRIVPVAGSEGAFHTVMAAGADRQQEVSLDHGWAYMWQSIARTEDGGRLLTIHLQGIGGNKGWEVETLFRAPAEPSATLGKAFTIVNRTGEDCQVRRVRFDRWTLMPRRGTAPSEVDRTTVKGLPALLDPATGTQVVATVPEPGADIAVSPIGGAPLALDVQLSAAGMASGTGGRFQTPWSYLTVVPRAQEAGRPTRRTGRPPRGR